MTLDISADHAIFDFGETVTLTQIRSNGNSTATVLNAVNTPLVNSKQGFGPVTVDGSERQWSLNATDVGAVGIQPQDRFTDAAGNAWRVLSAKLATGDARWMVDARKQV